MRWLLVVLKTTFYFGRDSSIGKNVPENSA